MSYSEAAKQWQSMEPRPPRVAALAVLLALRDAPMSPADRERWFGVGGGWWREQWRIMGYATQGDRFRGWQDLGWSFPVDEPAQFWDVVDEICADSDAWQRAQGLDAPPPKPNVAALLHRSTTWRQAFLSRWGWIWKGPPSSAHELQNALATAWAQLERWRRAAYPTTKRETPWWFLAVMLYLATRKR